MYTMAASPRHVAFQSTFHTTPRLATAPPSPEQEVARLVSRVAVALGGVWLVSRKRGFDAAAARRRAHQVIS